MNFTQHSYFRKIIIHNLSIPYEKLTEGLYDFDQNGIHFAKSGDIVVTRNRIPKTYLDFLSQCGYSFDDVFFVYTNSLLPNTHEAIFIDEVIIEKIKEILYREHNQSNFSLDSFMFTSAEAKWADKVNIDVVGSLEHYYELGTKSSFRVLAKKNDINIPIGYENQSTVLDGMLSASILFLRGAEEIVIKSDEGVAGLGSRRFTKQNFLGQFSTFKHFMENPHGVITARGLRFVIERWYSHTKYSPSIQLYISQNGQVDIVSTHIQIFYSENILRYKGCLSGNYLTDKELKMIETEGVRFGRAYAEKGYRGHIAFNTILLQDGGLLFVETNPRRVMSSYPHQIRMVLYGNDAPHIYYRSQHIQKDSWKGKNIDAVISSLSPILFSSTRKSGIVPFDYSLLFSIGRLSLVGFGSSKEEVSSLFDYVETI